MSPFTFGNGNSFALHLIVAQAVDTEPHHLFLLVKIGWCGPVIPSIDLARCKHTQNKGALIVSTQTASKSRTFLHMIHLSGSVSCSVNKG